MIHSYLTGLLFHPSTPDESSRSNGDGLLLPSIELPTGYNHVPSRFPSSRRHPLDGGHRSLDDTDELQPRHQSRRNTLTVEPAYKDGTSASSSRSTSPYPDGIIYPERSKSVVELRNDVEESTKCGDYSSIHDFYQQTFSSPIELVALLKRFPEKSSARIDDPELKVELLNELHDHINDLVSC